MSTGSRDFDANSDLLNSGTWGFTSTSVSIAGWVYLDSIPSGRDVRFMSKASGTTAAAHDWMIGYSESGGVATLRARTHNQSTTISGGSITTGGWRHVAITAIYNVGVQNEKHLYLNGSETSSDGTSDVVITSDTDAVYYGNQPTGGTHAPDGRLSDFAVWSVVLTPTQIADLAALTTRPSDYATGLEVYYSGGDTTDSSGNGRDASNTGTTLDADDPGFDEGAPSGGTHNLTKGLNASGLLTGLAS